MVFVSFYWVVSFSTSISANPYKNKAKKNKSSLCVCWGGGINHENCIIFYSLQLNNIII